MPVLTMQGSTIEAWRNRGDEQPCADRTCVHQLGLSSGRLAISHASNLTEMPRLQSLGYQHQRTHHAQHCGGGYNLYS